MMSDLIWEGRFSQPQKAPSSIVVTLFGIIYAGERVAPHKSTLSNLCDTIWDIYVSEGFATIK